MKEYLSQRGVSFRELDVARDAAAGQEMVRLSGQRGVPVVTIDRQVIVGFDRAGIDRALTAAQRPKLGAAVAAAATMQAQGRCSVGHGAYVGSVHPGGTAERAGLAVGDVIVALGGQDVRDDVQLQQLLAGVKSGSRVPVRLLRQDQPRELELAF